MRCAELTYTYTRFDDLKSTNKISCASENNVCYSTLDDVYTNQ